MSNSSRATSGASRATSGQRRRVVGVPKMSSPSDFAPPVTSSSDWCLVLRCDLSGEPPVTWLFFRRVSPEIIPFPLSVSSHSRRFPLSSVAFLDLRPPPAPTPEPPSPPAPPKPPDPPDPQICFCFGESLPQLPFSTFFRAFDSLLPPSSARSGFTSPASLPILPTKALVFMGLLLPVESPFAIWFGKLGARLCPATTLFRQVGYVADAPTFPPQTLPQVCSYSSPSNPSEMGIYWMLIEFVALVWWLSDLVHRVSMSLDTLVYTFVFFCSTHIALVRSITAVCRFCLNVVLLESCLLAAWTGIPVSVQLAS
ncbi:uncharacterized protein LOC9317209 [Arabidopsis lyrata subsp. lyrata]|nr:uncharacterized protein LOC9317209 [Arabidopsis lyrata subsp. lyrata]|eukprot:XP_020884713.1 uncharacterized protein LOC9317209 [Arabidopsis lyrata subsp. lyrata]